MERDIPSSILLVAADGRADAPQAHRPDVGGDESPRLVIRGESSEQTNPESGESYELVSVGGRGHLIAHPLPDPNANPVAAQTDWLNCTFPFERERLSDILQSLFRLLGPCYAPAKERGRGLHGWRESLSMGASSAMFAYGGQRGTALLSLPGVACTVIPKDNWPELVAYLRDSLLARISRWDGAVDDFEGVHSVDEAVELYQAGMFGSGGNYPECDQRGNWLRPNGRGRTFYVGLRENGKLLRVYEKGMQQGQPWHPWVRWELELHNKDRVIPWQAVLEPGKYVAGAYGKTLRWITEDMCRVRTARTALTVSYEHLSRAAKRSYGKLINLMLEVEGSPEKVIEKLRQDGMPARLDHPPIPGYGKPMPC